jgi:hypothetical protein
MGDIDSDRRRVQAVAVEDFLAGFHDPGIKSYEKHQLLEDFFLESRDRGFRPF